eukprot:TRINITY_DN17086_c0_g1_i2.p1 TRINITY_DN17086_c0_g1~~TRINITY_DN17086_c0_g1_i2.p1  ORF type:complete len:316 (+),score=37.03 TRINITY_DN17086_c0_g1_i2:101-1048(+)
MNRGSCGGDQLGVRCSRSEYVYSCKHVCSRSAWTSRTRSRKMASVATDRNVSERSPERILVRPPPVLRGVTIAVVVPFRNQLPLQDREAQLSQFLPYICDFLSSTPSARFRVFVVEQSDDGRKFNRGQLLNIGFKIAEEMLPDMDCFITHDCDLLPSMDMKPVYTNPPAVGSAVHLASVWPKYSYSTFIGGVLSFRPSDFKRVNGFPNDYWGWGLEDDQLALRLRHHRIRIARVRIGSYVDLDSMNMKQVLESQQQDEVRRHMPWYNVDMFRRTNLQLDSDWLLNGLANLSDWSVLSTCVDGFVHRVCVQLQPSR